MSGLTNVTAIAAGYNDSFALRNDGTVWAWGANFHGQLGTGSFTSQVRGFGGKLSLQHPTPASNLGSTTGTELSNCLKTSLVFAGQISVDVM